MKYKIQVPEANVVFMCDENEFLLDAMRKNGAGPIRYGCSGGGCGVCKMRVISGEIAIEKRMSRAHVTAEDETKGYILLCCVKPRGNMVLSR